MIKSWKTESIFFKDENKILNYHNKKKMKMKIAKTFITNFS